MIGMIEWMIWKDECLKGYINNLEGWQNGWMNEWKDERMKGWMNELNT